MPRTQSDGERLFRERWLEQQGKVSMPDLIEPPTYSSLHVLAETLRRSRSSETASMESLLRRLLVTTTRRR